MSADLLELSVHLIRRLVDFDVDICNKIVVLISKASILLLLSSVTILTAFF